MQASIAFLNIFPLSLSYLRKERYFKQQQQQQQYRPWRPLVAMSRLWTIPHPHDSIT